MNCLLAICLTLGITANTYDILEPSYSYNLKAGNDLYGWVSYEDQTTRILGQGLSDVGIYSFGVGARERWNKWEVFIEGGYAYLDETQNNTSRDEVVYTQLVQRHDVRPIPAGDPERDPDARTSYELGNGWVGRAGVSYELTGGLRASVAYRFLSVDEHYELWDVNNRAAGRGWWQETRGRDLSAFELGISYEF